MPANLYSISDLELNNDDQDEITADVVVNIREMDDVLIRDVGNKITESNKLARCIYVC